MRSHDHPPLDIIMQPLGQCLWIFCYGFLVTDLDIFTSVYWPLSLEFNFNKQMNTWGLTLPISGLLSSLCALPSCHSSRPCGTACVNNDKLQNLRPEHAGKFDYVFYNSNK